MNVQNQMARPTVLQTGRLILQPLAREDLDPLHAVFDDPAVRRYLFDDEPVSLETARALLRRSEEDFSGGDVGLFGIRRRGEGP